MVAGHLVAVIRSSKATAKASRAETRLANEVRRYVMDVRDDACRVACSGVGPCGGIDEWAHLGDKRRCFTRKMPPEERHSSRWTMKMCTDHHKRYDRHQFDVEFLLDIEGADGPIRVVKP